MPKPRFYVFFSFMDEEPWLAFNQDNSLKKAISRAEFFLKRGRRPDGDFIDSAFVYEADYDEDYEDWFPVGEPVWYGETDIQISPLDAEDYNKHLSYWIDPYGDVFAVPIHGHDKIASMLLRAGIVTDIEEGMFGSAPYQSGWLQVTTEPGRSTTFNFKTEPTQRQLDALFDIVLAHKSLEYSDNSKLFVRDAMKWIGHPEVTRKNPRRFLDVFRRFF